VGTPVGEDGVYELNQLKNAVEFSVNYLQKNPKKTAKVIIRSTLPPNCMKETVFPYVKSLSKKSKEPEVIYFPEFLREGSALSDLKEAPLFLVGAKDAKTDAKWIEKCFQVPKGKLIVTDTSAAEMTKVTSNIFHALKVCFSNEVAMSCSAMGIDSKEVMRIFCNDKKLNISAAYLKPGFSFGGPCLEKELLGLVTVNKNNGKALPILQSIDRSNEARFESAANGILKLKNKYQNLGILGTAFKAESVDKRNSPVCRLIEILESEFKLFSFKEEHRLTKNTSEFEEFLKNTDAVILGSSQLTKSDIKKILAKKKPVIDLRINFEYARIFKDYKFYSSVLDYN
jgi:GDP-mannose 6-dehydrogenase